MNFQKFIYELSTMFNKAFSIYNIKIDIDNKLIATKSDDDSYNEITIHFDKDRTKYSIQVDTKIFIDEQFARRFSSISETYDLNFDISCLIKIKLLIMDMIQKNMKFIEKDFKKFLSIYNNINV